MRQIVSVIASLAVGLLMAAAGLALDVETLTIAGAILFGLAAVLWLYEWGRAGRRGVATTDFSERDRRRGLIKAARRLAAGYSEGRSGDATFRHFLERTETYATLRSHLSPEYLVKLNAPRTSYAQPDGARYEPLVEWFLDDLDRLEREWKLA